MYFFKKFKFTQLGPKIGRMERIFEDCNSLTSLDLSNFDANPSYITNAFKNCFSLEELKIPKLKTEDCLYPYGIFENCYSLKSLDLSSFIMISAKNLYSLFKKRG